MTIAAFLGTVCEMEPRIIARGPQILIVERDDWRAFYDAEKQALERVAGPLLLAFEHVGSTAIPGLPGKPVIDILAGMKALEDGPALADRLRASGYVPIPFRPAAPAGTSSADAARLFFLKRPVEMPEGVDLSHPGFNIHVVPMDRFCQDDQILLRDHLRKHPELVAEYARLKCEIVGRMADYREYTPAKSRFIEDVLKSARRK